jgi:hypothetical protein
MALRQRSCAGQYSSPRKNSSTFRLHLSTVVYTIGQLESMLFLKPQTFEENFGGLYLPIKIRLSTRGRNATPFRAKTANANQVITESLEQLSQRASKLRRD